MYRQRQVDSDFEKKALLSFVPDKEAERKEYA